MEEIKEGQGKVVKYEGESFAIVKANGGKVTMLRSTCPHAGCQVRWNTAELTWDYPCQGSRFGVDGQALSAPATTFLQKAEIPD